MIQYIYNRFTKNIMKKLILLSIFAFYAGIAFGQWDVFQIPTNQTINSMHLFSEDTLIVAGNTGFISISVNGGCNWINKISGVTQNLNSIYFANDYIGYAVGNSGTLIKSIDRGSTWFPLNSGSTSTLNSVYFTSIDTGFFCGGYPGLIRKTTDGGLTWITVNSGTALSSYNAIVFLNSTTGFVAGKGFIKKTTNSGNTWTNVLTQSADNITKICFPTALVGYAILDDSLRKTVNGGNTWTVIPAINQPTDIAFFTANIGYMASWATIHRTTDGGVTWYTATSPDTDHNLYTIKIANSTKAYFAGQNGSILRTIDQGLNWTAPPNGTPNNLRSVFFVNDQIGFASGAGGRIIKSIDGGIHWNNQTSGSPQQLNSTFFLDENTGYTAGNAGTLLKTSNGGTSWSTINLGITNNLYSVFFINNNKGFVVGDNGKFLKTINGGTTWTSQYFPSFNINSIYFVNDTVGYLAGTSGYIYKTINGGSTWTYISPPSITYIFNSVFFLTPEIGYVAGNGGRVLKTTDGGLTWDNRTLIVSDFYSIAFRDMLNGIVVGTNNVTYRTIDGGNTWSYLPIDNKLQSLCSLNSIFFTNSGHGWIAADIGHVYKYFGAHIDCFPSQAICSSEQVFLNCSPGYTYNWSPSNLLSQSNISNPVTSPTTTTTYHVTVTEGYYSATDSTTIIILPTCNNTVKGIVYRDINKNGIQDIGEAGIPNVIIRENPGSLYFSTNSLGKFSASAGQGNFIFDIPNLPPNYESVPLADTINFISTGLIDSTSFGLQIDSINNVSIDLSQVSSPVPGHFNKILLTFSNLGIDTANGSINFNFDNTLTFISSIPVQNSYLGNTLTWNYFNLLPGQSNTIEIKFYVQPTTPIGTQLTSNGMIYPIIGDTIPLNNYDTLHQVVVVSNEPNGKFSEPDSLITMQEIQNEIYSYYTIRFQNTGSSVAHDILIIDTLSQHLNLSSFELVSSSDPCTFTMTGSGVVNFLFNNINLPDSSSNEYESHGFVKYRIKLKPNISVTSIINNTAHILFDFINPISTNTTHQYPYALPGQIDTITGTHATCSGSTIVLTADSSIYSTSYAWTFPQGFHSTGTSNINIIDIDTTAHSGYVVVSGQNQFGIGVPDSIFINIFPSYLYNQAISICQGDSIILQDGTYGHEDSTYTFHFHTLLGCDSIYTLHLTVNPVYTYSENHSICNNTPYLWHGQNLTTTGIFYDSLQTINGCDSTFTLNLTVNPTYTYNEYHSICSGETYNWHGTNYTTANTYTANYTNVNGCDSIYTLYLTVNPVYSFTENHSICNGETYNWQGTNYSTANTYTANYTSVNGCDSTFTLNLSVLNIDTSLTVTDPTIISNSNGSIYQWVDCDNAFAIISGMTSQSYTATVNGNYAVIITQGLCSDTSTCIQITSLNIASITNNGITIYPNPVKNELIIEFKENHNKLNFEILNSIGQVVFNGTLLEKTIIQTTTFTSGVYLIKLDNGKTFEFKKIVKE